MMNVRIRPAAPTIEPAMMSTLLPMTKPVKAAAMPESELSYSRKGMVPSPGYVNDLTAPTLAA